MSARWIAATAIALALALLASSAAFAASRPGYQNVPNADGEAGFPAGNGVLGSSEGGGGAGAGDGVLNRDAGAGDGVPGPGAGGGSGGLPYTGVNLIVLAAFGCVLLVCGLLLMRASREP